MPEREIFHANVLYISASKSLLNVVLHTVHVYSQTSQWFVYSTNVRSHFVTAQCTTSELQQENILLALVAAIFFKWLHDLLFFLVWGTFV